MNDTLEKIIRGAHQVAPLEELKNKLSAKKVLKVKLGVDPTAPNLHLGHAVVLSKLKNFQDLGHEVIFLIGDFTAKIGDPTGRSKTRPPLSDEEIQKNTKTFFAQVGRILDTKKIKIRYNSEWLNKLTSKDWLELFGKITLARIIEREDFNKRIKENQPIGFHELMYPLMQGYDSVALEADVELGGTDQTFNMLTARFLQQQYNMEPQIVVSMPILEGLNGKIKMSKSIGNTIDLVEEPGEVFGKIMSISDDLMWRYYELLLESSQEEINKMKEAAHHGKIHPKELKKKLAYKILEKFWGPKDAEKGREAFESLFEKKDLTQAKPVKSPVPIGEKIWIADLLRAVGAAGSSSEVRRLIEGGGVSVNQEKISDFKAQIKIEKGMTIKVGKHRFYKIDQ